MFYDTFSSDKVVVHVELNPGLPQQRQHLEQSFFSPEKWP
jgi:hypothetical protein